MVVSKALLCPENVSPSSHSTMFFHCTCIPDRHGKNFRGYLPHILSKLRCTRLLRMSPDWIKFDTQLIVSVQLLIRKRKIEKNSCVFKKKKGTTNETSLIGYETIIFQVLTVSRPWAKLFNYINIKDFSYHKKGQHSPTPAVWLFLRILSKLDERTVPVSFSGLEMSFMGIEQEE